jgi:hypothetical protein
VVSYRKGDCLQYPCHLEEVGHHWEQLQVVESVEESPGSNGSHGRSSAMGS